MSRAREFRLESLECRALLSAVPHVGAHAKHAVAAVALVLSGTLKVDNNAAMMSMDENGDTITTTPVVGQLGTLGKVHGTWSTGEDEYGDYMGPDTLTLHAASGTFSVAFNEQRTTVSHIAGGAVSYDDPQIASQGTGAFAGERESGSIVLTTNKAHNQIETMTLSS